MRVGDFVLVNRPKLPARIGRVVKLGKRKIHVGLGRYGPNYRVRRYSYASVEVLFRRI